MGSRRPYDFPLKSQASSKLFVDFCSINFMIRPMTSPPTSPMPADTPTQTSSHPTLSILVMVYAVEMELAGWRVCRSTEQLQQVLRTVGETTKVPRKLTNNTPISPKLSLIVCPFTRGKIFSKKRAETKPAISPQAMAAPILTQVPATGPQMMAPVIVPTSDPLMPSLALWLSSTDPAQLAMTEALRAMKVEMKASCQMKARSDSDEETVYLVVQKGVVAQKARNRKKVPKCAVTAELLLLLNSTVVEVTGCLRMRLAMMPQQAAKRQMPLIWQSSMKRLSGELMARKAHRKQLRFQQKLNPTEFKTICAGFSLPNRARAVTSWAIELAIAILRLQKSMQIYCPPKLYCRKREGSLGVGVAPLKLVMKILNQNFWKMGDRMAVSETVMILVKSAEKVAFLRQDSSRPNPITTKIDAMMQRLPRTVCVGVVLVRPVVGYSFVVALRISPAYPYTQRTPASTRSRMAPAAWLARLGLDTVTLVGLLSPRLTLSLSAINLDI